MHVGRRNERAICNMGNHRLEEVEEESDIRVLIYRTLHVSQQQLCCGGQESEPEARTNCCTTVKGSGETISGVLLTDLVTLSKEGYSKH